MDPERWCSSRQEAVVCTKIPPFDTSEGCMWENDPQLDGSLRLSEVMSIQPSPAG